MNETVKRQTLEVPTMSRALTVRNAICLAHVIRAAQSGKTVARMVDGTVYVGEARSIGSEYGAPAIGADVRDCFLRVTLDGGAEACWPIGELLTEAESGEFVADYRR